MVHSSFALHVVRIHREADDSHGKILDLVIVPALLARLKDSDENIRRFVFYIFEELAKHGIFSALSEICASIHREADDSRDKMLDSNIILALLARLELDGRGVRRLILHVFKELAKHSTCSPQYEFIHSPISR